MKALITAGGRATRLRPITHTINKHLIPLANKPMIFHAIEKVVDAGITDIGININEGDRELPEAVGDGSRWGARVTYLEQKGGARGLAHIIKNAKDLGFLSGPFLMYLGDNIVIGSIRPFVQKFVSGGYNCMLALSRVKEPQRFGVPEIRDGRIVRVVEKPQVPPSDYAVTGIYLYDEHALAAVDSIQPSVRGEYEITDVHQYYIDRGLSVGFQEITGWWKDTGKPEDLLEGNQLLLNELNGVAAPVEGYVDPGATIQGRVQIGKRSKVGPKVMIRGPVVIGENCVIENSFIGPHTSIGNDVNILGAEIEHSIVMDQARINTPARIVDSIVGKNAVVVSEHSTQPSGHKLVVGDNAMVEL